MEQTIYCVRYSLHVGEPYLSSIIYNTCEEAEQDAFQVLKTSRDIVSSIEIVPATLEQEAVKKISPRA